MKLFLDTANLREIGLAKETGLITGVTTNPTLLSRESGNIYQLLKDICQLMAPYDVNIEITELDPEKLYYQAQKIAAIAPNVVVKIPCSQEYSIVIDKLVREKIAINITLLFSVLQGLLMSKLGVKYISPFIGRLEDINGDGIELIRDLKIIKDNYNFKTEILAASIRTIEHVHKAALIGIDIATINFTIFNSLYKHPLSIQGIEKFSQDWKKLDIKQFP